MESAKDVEMDVSMKTRGDMKTGVARNMGAAEWLLLIALSVIWGGSFFFGKLAVREVPPFTIVLGRVGLAAVILNVLLLMKGGRIPRDPRLLLSFLVMGALNNLVPFSLIFWGQTRIASGLASILNATTPFWTVALAHFLTRDEPLTANRLGGVLLGLAGVVVMVGPSVLGDLGANGVAQIAVLGAALCYALAAIFGRRLGGIPPLTAAAGQLAASTLMAFPLALAIDKPWNLLPLSLVSWGALIGLALLCTAVAYIIYFRILATAGATNLLLVTFLIPVSSLLLGVTILGETLETGQLIGMALIGLGLAAIDGRPFGFLWKRRALGPASGNVPPDHYQGMDI